MPKKKRKGFLENFLGTETEPKKAPKKKNSIRHDKFDTEMYNNIIREVESMSKAEDKLAENVKTGGPAFADLFYSLMKAIPAQEEVSDMAADFLINHGVFHEMMDLKEWNELRDYCPGDEVSSALACVSLEPDVEILFDRLQKEQELADQLQEKMQQLSGLDDQLTDIETMEERWGTGGGAAGKQGKGKIPAGFPTDEDGNPDFQQAKEQIQAQMEQLRQEMEEIRQEIAEKMEKAAPAIQATLKKALQKAADEQANLDQASLMWGMEAGELRRMPAAERLEMAKRLNNPKFKRLAEIFGPMRNIAFTEQYRKVDYAQEEMYDIELGNDLGKVLPTEFMNLRHPLLKRDFMRKYLEGSLLQYKLRGQERVGKGGVVCCVDSSGSMSGEPDIWAKAFALALLHICVRQKRPFYGIIFGSSREIMEFDFPVTENQMPMDKVLDFAEFAFMGGTDFMRPLSVGMDKLQADFDAHGWMKSDIIFVTDGVCGVSDDWLKAFQEQQAKLDFRVFGVAIGPDHMAESEPLATLCDGGVLPVSSILDSKEESGHHVRDIFRSL